MGKIKVGIRIHKIFIKDESPDLECCFCGTQNKEDIFRMYLMPVADTGLRLIGHRTSLVVCDICKTVSE